ncbi:expansin-B15-like [Cannabis sativa]|uniref:expansin-B15-like n=1 Tax=Cannabis sativa TaxID=3483 RepID=UPI0029CA44D6|nr:expansin-B15-like [Cannabis sativa]
MGVVCHDDPYLLSVIVLIASISLLVNLNRTSAFNPIKLFNVSSIDVDRVSANWASTGATWYGSPNGAGSSGGACGYGGDVGQPPFSSFISAGGPSLYRSHKGCGVCYEVKCTSNVNRACSGNPVNVVITDECPGCNNQAVHFDLSGTAFGAMAISGQADQLRNVGVLQIQYNRVQCRFGEKSITFKVDLGSNDHYFSSLIEFINGAGELEGVELKQSQGSWVPMQRSWGAVWKLNSSSTLKPPFSIRLTSMGQTIVANNVIPVGWIPGQTYRSTVNFAT